MSSKELATRSPNQWKAASEELTKALNFAIQLESLLLERSPANPEQASITKEVTATISRALLALDYLAKTEAEESEDEKAIKKRRIQIVRRGGYRRRSHAPISRTIKSSSIEDGHAWRKYGQKDIHNTKFPRSYFRCTHKSDQGCKATRQVQPSEENPSLFVITYFGEHTCRDPMDQVLPSPCFQREDASQIINFAAHSNIAAASGCYQQHQPLFPMQKACGGSSLADCCDESVKLVGELTGVVSENSNITSGHDQQSAGESLEWDFIEESLDICDMLGLGDDVLF